MSNLSENIILLERKVFDLGSNLGYNYCEVEKKIGNFELSCLMNNLDDLKYDITNLRDKATALYRELEYLESKLSNLDNDHDYLKSKIEEIV